MAMRLFAHTLMKDSAATSAGGDPSMTFRPLDFGRWVLGELVVRRGEPMGWGLPMALRPRSPARNEAPVRDSIWADTQPVWHE
jgi:hypothetical protein